MSFSNRLVCLLCCGVVVGLVAAQVSAVPPACCEPDGSCFQDYCVDCNTPNICNPSTTCSYLTAQCKINGQGPCTTVNDACWHALNCTSCGEPTQPTPEPAVSEEVCWADEEENVCWADDVDEALEG
ncbi:MAG: hypothetical protein PVI86_14975 [Phycisphaerae bacterium]|jgi:hypothetical protein